jgi:para-aminobenzoate synthetase / 4-amino-4-deoxychorismate lyase
MAAVPGPSRPDPQQGVFETLLVVDGRPVELDAHLARLGASLAELFPDRPAPQLVDAIQARAHGIGLGKVQTMVEPANGTLLAKAWGTSLLAAGAFFPHTGDKAPGRSTALHSLEVPGGLGAHKWIDRSLLNQAQAGLPDDALPLLVDTDGALLEASRANLFVVRDGALFTPPLDGRILPGITRMRVLEIAAGTGVETRETALRREDLLVAEEVFLTGSVRGIERVTSLDGTPLAAGSEPKGRSVASELAGELRRAWLGAPVA